MRELTNTNFYLFYKDDKKEVEEVYNQIKKYKYINGEKCTNLRKTFKEFSKTFKFPDYFSYNWDSFDECINDLDWLNENEYILIIDNCEKVLENEKENFEYLLELLNYTAYEWKKGRDDSFPAIPTLFDIILVYNAENKNKIEKFFENLKIKFDYIKNH